VACSPDIPKLSGSGSIRTSRPFWDREFEQSCQECEHVLILLLAHSSTNYIDVALKRHWHDVILLRQVARCSAITSLQGTAVRSLVVFDKRHMLCNPNSHDFQPMPALLSIRIYRIDWLDRKMLLHVPGMAAQHQRGGRSGKQPFLDSIPFLSHCHLFQLATTVLLSKNSIT